MCSVHGIFGEAAKVGKVAANVFPHKHNMLIYVKWIQNAFKRFFISPFFHSLSFYHSLTHSFSPLFFLFRMYVKRNKNKTWIDALFEWAWIVKWNDRLRMKIFQIRILKLQHATRESHMDVCAYRLNMVLIALNSEKFEWRERVWVSEWSERVCWCGVIGTKNPD